MKKRLPLELRPSTLGILIGSPSVRCNREFADRDGNVDEYRNSVSGKDLEGMWQGQRNPTR